VNGIQPYASVIRSWSDTEQWIAPVRATIWKIAFDQINKDW